MATWREVGELAADVSGLEELRGRIAGSWLLAAPPALDREHLASPEARA